MKKRTAQRVDLVSEGGFARFLSIAHSLANQGLISLSVGEPDFKTPWHICEAAIEALKAGENDIQQMVAEYDRRRKVLVKGLNDIGLTCHEPKGAFYAFPSVKVTGLTSDEFVEKVLLEEKVLILPGSLFGAQGEGFVRICYAYSLPHIEEALRRLTRFVPRHRRS